MLSFILNLAIFAPLLSAFAILTVPHSLRSRIAKITRAGTLICFSASILLAIFFEPAGGSQFTTDIPWMTYSEARYHVGVDGISVFLVLAISLISLLTALSLPDDRRAPSRSQQVFLLVFTTGAIGVLVALDLLLLFVFWEIALVAVYFLLGAGNPARANIKVNFYVLFFTAGSFLMLLGIAWLHSRFGSFDYTTLLRSSNSSNASQLHANDFWMMLMIFGSFAFVVPLFPLHTWFPQLQTSTSKAGAVLTSSVLPQLGGYGILRYCVALFPDASHEFAPAVNLLACFGILTFALRALVQSDPRRVISYATLAYMGFVPLGLFSFNHSGISGAVFHMMSLGLTICIFVLLAEAQERDAPGLPVSGSKSTGPWKPRFTPVFLLSSLALAGLPLLNIFVGIYLILTGVVQNKLAVAVAALIGLMMLAITMLWMAQRVIGGDRSGVRWSIADLMPREKLVFLPACLLLIFLGVAPASVLAPMDPTISSLVDRVSISFDQAKVEALEVAPVSHPSENRELWATE